MTDAAQLRMAELSAEKRRLLQHLLDGAETPGPVTPAGEAPPRWRVTPGQRRTYLMQREGPETTYCNMCLGVRVRGPFDPMGFSRAVTRLARRHRVLDATFCYDDGHVYQVLEETDRPPQVRIESVDTEEALPQAWQDEHDRPFDLDREGPLRGRVLRIGEQDHGLLLTVHHIVMDGWSANILLRDLDGLLSAELGRQRVSLPPADLQFIDFARWQQVWLRSWARFEQSRFWRTELPDEIPLLDLPSTLPRPAKSEFDHGHVPIKFTTELSTGVRQLAAAEGATPYAVLLAAFAVLVSRLTGVEDLVVASPVANRSQVELEQVVGLFANLVPVRIDLRGAGSLRDVVRATRAATRRALTNQELPFEELITELAPRARPDRSPFSQLIFGLYNYPRHEELLTGLEVEPLPADPSDALRIYAPTGIWPDMCVRIYDRAATQELSGIVEYNQRAIDPDSAERHVARYLDTVRELVADPDATR